MMQLMRVYFNNTSTGKITYALLKNKTPSRARAEKLSNNDRNSDAMHFGIALEPPLNGIKKSRFKTRVLFIVAQNVLAHVPTRQ